MGGLEVLAIILAYLITIMLVLGGFSSMWLGYKLVRHRSQVATSSSNFSVKWGDSEFSATAGSLAALALLVSAFWIGAALLARPRVEYQSSGEAGTVGVLKFLSNVEMKTNEDEYRQLEEQRESLEMALNKAEEIAERNERAAAKMLDSHYPDHGAADAAAAVEEPRQ